MHLSRILFALVLCFHTQAFSQEDAEQTDVFDLPKVVALQNRAYYLNQGLDAHLGYLPIDAFNKGIIFGVGYTHYYSDFFAWEIVNANYNFNIETDLREDLRGLNVDVVEQDKNLLDFVNWYATTSIIYTPLYNKSLLFNKSVVYGETSFLFGAGAAQFDIQGLLPIVSLGVIVKFFLSPKSSINVDVREHVYFPESGVDGMLALSVGFAYQLGDPPKKNTVIEEEDEEF